MKSSLVVRLRLLRRLRIPLVSLVRVIKTWRWLRLWILLEIRILWHWLLAIVRVLLVHIHLRRQAFINYMVKPMVTRVSKPAEELEYLHYSLHYHYFSDSYHKFSHDFIQKQDNCIYQWHIVLFLRCIQYKEELGRLQQTL